MKIQDIKRGKTIELLQSFALADGTEITFEIEPMNLMSDEERQKKLRSFSKFLKRIEKNLLPF